MGIACIAKCLSERSLLEELVAGGAAMRAAATALDALAKEVQQDATLVLRAGRQQDAKAMVTDGVGLARTALAFLQHLPQL